MAPYQAAPSAVQYGLEGPDEDCYITLTVQLSTYDRSSLRTSLREKSAPTGDSCQPRQGRPYQFALRARAGVKLGQAFAIAQVHGRGPTRLISPLSTLIN